MKFYKIDVMHNVDSDDGLEEPRPRGRRGIYHRNELGIRISKESKDFTEKICDKGYFFLSFAYGNRCTFGMVVRTTFDISKFVKTFLEKVCITPIDISIRETTLREFNEMLEDGDTNDYVYDPNSVLQEYELDQLLGRSLRIHSFSHYDESLIQQREKKAIYLSAENYFTKNSLISELDRIYFEKGKRKAYGHPVNYMIESDDERTRVGNTQLLLQSLYDVGRVENQRYCGIDIYPHSDMDKGWLGVLYKSCSGGSIVLNFNGDIDEDTDLAHGDYSIVVDICEVAKRNCREVLTIMCLSRECSRLKRMIFENMCNTTFVEIKEELAIGKAAVDYLKGRTKEYKIRSDKKLFESLEKERGYLPTELNAIFDEWYNKKLKTTIYSQYRDIAESQKEVREAKPKGSAYDELSSMTGLESAKRIIDQAIDSYKAQIIFKDKGMRIDKMCNHMVFTGNPGTAKTTVARLFARIMKENDILSQGHIVEVGRGDLVGKYVGWTAPTIKKKFNMAKGGILFIDEAYSLVDDRNGSFGDEAINTIVQEMENHRDEVIVIFAGYPDKMENFLDKNPGLRSRIAHYVHFEDYNTEELCEIATLIARNKGLSLEKNAMKKLSIILEEARTHSDFGNGRYVRNVIEKAQLAQSSRLIHMDYDSVTSKDVKLICAEDIEPPITGKQKEEQRIGFAVA